MLVVTTRATECLEEMIMKSLPILALLALAHATTAVAGASGTTAATCLELGPSPRILAMGGAHTALVSDASALCWNPAGLARIESSELIVSHHSHPEGLGLARLALGTPIAGGTIGAFATYADAGEMEGTDNYGEPTARFGASTLTGALGYARGERLAVGFSLGFVRDSIEDSEEAAAFISAGGLWEATSHLGVGASVLNLGGQLGGDPLPLCCRVGAAVSAWSVSAALDAVIPSEGDPYVQVGGEWQAIDALAVRLGYDAGRDVGSGLSAGLGVLVGRVRMDYAYVPYGDLGNTHSYGMAITLGTSSD